MNAPALRSKPPPSKPVKAPRIRIAVSSCLLGERVRYDGDHKRSAYVTEVLANEVDLVPVCPEVAIGMGVPREPIRLVQTGRGLRAIGTQSRGLDVTDRLQEYGRLMAEKLTDIDGYLFKQNSPSCGMAGVRIDKAGHAPSRTGAGLYAQTVMAQRPWLPAAEEERLNDPALRENFFERVLAHHRWRRMEAEGITPAALVEFHARHKFLVMAHSQAAYRRLGRLVAEAGSQPIEALAASYMAELMAALRRCATRQGHINVLMHLLGFLRPKLNKADRIEFLESIESYRRRLVPLITPITLLNHHFQLHPDPCISKQYYLNPYPAELMLQSATR